MQETRQCDIDRTVYSDPNDLIRFGTLIVAGGREWDVCGDCITLLWSARGRGMTDA